MNDVQRQNYRGNEAALAWRGETGATRNEGRAARFKAEKQGIAAWITREVAAAWGACGAFGGVALGDLAASRALIAVFAENLAHRVNLLGLQSRIATRILVLFLVETLGAT